MAIPLKKNDKNGTSYKRRSIVEKIIDDLEELPFNELIKKCTAFERPVPIEVLLYFLRNKVEHTKSLYYKKLFEAFYTRLELSLTKSISEQQFGQANALHIRDDIIGKVLEFLALDHKGECLKLDYYEVNFSQSLQTLRYDILRKVGPASNKVPLANSVPLTVEDGEESEISPEVEIAAADFFSSVSSELENDNFRFQLKDAINKLPDKERRVIGLMLQGMQVESIDPEVPTIAKTLNCTERTVRNRLKSAYGKLREILPVEEEQ